MQRIIVIRTEKGQSRRITLTEEIFKRIVDRPRTFGTAGRQNPENNVKYERAPLPVIKKQIIAKPYIDGSETDKKQYTEEDYIRDRDSGKNFLKLKEYTKALECFKRAEVLKPSVYMKGKIKKCNEGLSS